ncbi:DUF3139 domain-containing protein [Bacillus mycoides]|uniref:DUF3139 domain-containing protein n=1 Tax=Bacillus mycoides TaxID=1405 RepID=UPI002E07F225|nr:DUF3139 domain-containing protein [Bacillus mycoides]MEC5267475.1 DUF3139 domain-containing protein [Bacillus mycoides]
MKKGALIITYLLLIISLFIIGKGIIDRYFITGDPKLREEAIIGIMWHLEEKGYTKSDVLEIKSSFNDKIDQYGAHVKFKDEPNIWYKYVRWDNPHTDKVEFGQGDNGERGKHTELK